MASERRKQLLTLGAAVAVFALLGTDTVAAANKVTSKEIKNGTIQTEDMKKGAITSAKVKDQSLTGTDIKDGSIGAADLSAAAKDSLATTYSGPNWSIVDRNVTGNADSYLRSGPSSGADIAPPYGIGSLGVRVASGDKSAFGNQVDFVGDPLSGVTTVAYSIFTTGENNDQNPDNLPSVAFEIDPTGFADATGPNFSTLVYVASTVEDNTWTVVPASDNERWFLTGAAGTQSGCTQAAMCTLADAAAEFPDAQLLTAQITKGTDTFSFSGAVDGLQVNDVVYDFEPFGVTETTPAP